MSIGTIVFVLHDEWLFQSPYYESVIGLEFRCGNNYGRSIRGRSAIGLMWVDQSDVRYRTCGCDCRCGNERRIFSTLGEVLCDPKMEGMDVS